MPNNHIYIVSGELQQELTKALSSIELLNEKRLRNAQYMIDRIDHSKYTVQVVPEGGVSNRNRLLLRMIKPVAKQTILTLRKSGIAANNLTQNYLNGYQSHIKEDRLLGDYYTNKLDNYENLLHTVIAIPCSAFLSKVEMNFITDKLNSLA